MDNDSHDSGPPTRGLDEPVGTPEAAGQAFAGFQVKGELGRGGVGVVQLAREQALRRDVALKTAAGAAASNPAQARRFLEEAIITAQLQHPGVVPVYRVGKDLVGRDYYAMRPIEGRTLKAILADLRKGTAETIEEYSLRRLVRIFHSVCQTIRFAHDRGVIHRDLKPANIVVGDYGEVLVIDWGLAKVLASAAAAPEGAAGEDGGAPQGVWATLQRRVEDPRAEEESGTQNTMDGAFLGTPAYASPEQVNGRIGQIDTLSDIWSLGVILYELCTLKLPFEGASVREVAAQITASDPPDPMRADPHRPVPPELAEIILRCLNRDRAGRYGSVAELAQAVENWLEGLAPWKVVADIDFSQLPDGPPDGWVLAYGGSAYIRNGCLVSTSYACMAMLNAAVGGDSCVEVEAMVEPGREGEIGIMLDSTELRHPDMRKAELYMLLYGGDGNRCAKILRKSSCTARMAGGLVPGRWYQVMAEHQGNLLRLTVDGKELLACRDYDPLAGRHVGLYSYGDGLRVRRFRALSRGLPMVVSALAVPRAFHRKGLIEDAAQEYAGIAESHPWRQEGLEAAFLAGRCHVDLARKVTDAVERDRLLGRARGFFDHLEQSHLGPLGCLGKALIYECLGQTPGEVGELARAYRDYPGHEILAMVGQHLWDRVWGARNRKDTALRAYLPVAVALHPSALLSPRNWLCLKTNADVALARQLGPVVSRIAPTDRGLQGLASLCLGEALYWQGRFQEALRVFTDLAQEHVGVPDSVLPRETLHATATMWAGKALIAQGQYQEGIECCQRVVQEYPDDCHSRSEAMRVMGEGYFASKRPDEAATWFGRCASEYRITTDYEASEALIGLGRVHASRGEFDKALACFEEAPQVCGMLDTLSSTWKGNIHRAQGRYDAALASYQTAQEQTTPGHANYAEALFGRCFVRILQGDRQAVGNLIGQAADGWYGWAFRAAAHPQDPEVPRDLAEHALYIHWHELALGLTAYARGDDQEAGRHLKAFFDRANVMPFELVLDSEAILAAVGAGG